ncbi:MAG: hypothetical protein SGPRY_013326 [Prymnesium sp.]
MAEDAVESEARRMKQAEAEAEEALAMQAEEEAAAQLLAPTQLSEGDDEDSEDDEDDDASSCHEPSDTYDDTSAYDEDEAAYENQPAAGLSPRLVLKRAVETLQASDTKRMYCGPDLCRVDTFSNFQGTIDSADLDIAVSDIDETPTNTTENCPATTPLPPSIARGDTADRVGSLEEVADAFAAVESAGKADRYA